jgi:hypothetical protein
MSGRPEDAGQSTYGHLQKPDFRRLIGGVLAIGQCGGDGTVDLDEVSTSRVLWFARFSV